MNDNPGYPKHPLEHPALTCLFQDLVQKGDFDASERHIENIIELDLGARHMRGLDSIQITPIELTGSEEPPWRQFFSLANEGNELYLYGGCECQPLFIGVSLVSEVCLLFSPIQCHTE